MSVINKEPFIKKLLASCSSEELDTLSTLINGGGNQTPIKRTANPIDTPEIPHISVSDKGIHLCSLTINYTNFLGYLVYTDLFCALISFTDAQVLKIFDLTEDKTRPNTIDEAINILELRSTLFEVTGGSGGGGSGGGGSVENNIVDVCFAGSSINSGDELHLYMFKNDYQEWLENNNVTESELLSTFNNLSGLEQIGFLNNIGAHFNNIKSIYQAVKLHDNNSLKQAISCSYRIDDLENPEAWSFSVEYISGPGPENSTIVYRNIDLVTGLAPSPSSGYDYASTLSVSTLDLVTGSSQGGGSVEAEPIVSIKMTNLDLRTADDSPDADLNNVQLYCTKETWNNMVAMAKQLDSSLDITYANFGTIYSNLPTETQGFLVGYLMMDYIDGKVLPNAYAEDVDDYASSDIHGQGFLNRTTTLQSANTNNIKVALGGYFANNVVFPSEDRANVPYTTANTVITVEEIEGASIGSSSGSGSSADTLKNYKELLTFYDQNGDKICGISKILSLKTKEWYYGVLNNGIQSAASMLGLTIPTVTDDSTTQSGINTILGAMQQAGVGANIPQLIMNFVTDFDFVIKERVSNAGTEIYPLFVTGDISAYILYGNGTMTDLLQTFDFTGAYTVDYSLMEVNVTD